ncbi:unnamed protein product [Cyclocybe aegerita]|uniref:Uncharacterized protein n=1 Tax=Cyclocybe aegerita TaxID=1973307 RepID=A0A8S0VSN3_CYCAE|nr:unnamed protein product [Cyclocybe aegerita]
MSASCIIIRRNCRGERFCLHHSPKLDNMSGPTPDRSSRLSKATSQVSERIGSSSQPLRSQVKKNKGLTTADAESPQKLYLRINRKFLLLHYPLTADQQDKQPLPPPPGATTNLNVIIANLPELRPFAGDTIDWLVKVARLIFEPLGTTSLYTFSTESLEWWLDREMEASQWRKVVPGEPLKATIYEFRPDNDASILALTRMSLRSTRSVTTRTSVPRAATFRGALFHRDRACVVTQEYPVLSTKTGRRKAPTLGFSPAGSVPFDDDRDTQVLELKRSKLESSDIENLPITTGPQKKTRLTIECYVEIEEIAFETSVTTYTHSFSMGHPQALAYIRPGTSPSEILIPPTCTKFACLHNPTMLSITLPICHPREIEHTAALYVNGSDTSIATSSAVIQQIHIAAITQPKYTRSLALVVNKMLQDLHWRNVHLHVTFQETILDLAQSTFLNYWNHVFHGTRAELDDDDDFCEVNMDAIDPLAVSSYIGDLFSLGLLSFKMFDRAATYLVSRMTKLSHIHCVYALFAHAGAYYNPQMSRDFLRGCLGLVRQSAPYIKDAYPDARLLIDLFHYLMFRIPRQIIPQRWDRTMNLEDTLQATVLSPLASSSQRSISRTISPVSFTASSDSSRESEHVYPVSLIQSSPEAEDNKKAACDVQWDGVYDPSALEGVHGIHPIG